MAFGLDDIIAEGMKILDKFIPDPQAKMQAQIQMMQITQSDRFKTIDAILQEEKGQTDTNLAEAQSPSLFKSGWRPCVGWVCSIGFGLHVLIFPLVAAGAQMAGYSFTPPTLSVELLMSTLMGMLGIGGMRTYEKTKGVA